MSSNRRCSKVHPHQNRWLLVLLNILVNITAVVLQPSYKKKTPQNSYSLGNIWKQYPTEGHEQEHVIPFTHMPVQTKPARNVQMHRENVDTCKHFEPDSLNTRAKCLHYGLMLIMFLVCFVCRGCSYRCTWACVVRFDAIITLMMYRSINKLKRGRSPRIPSRAVFPFFFIFN